MICFANSLPRFACAACGAMHAAASFLTRSGDYAPNCAACRAKESTRRSKQRPAYKAMAREQQRALMQRRRFAVDDAIRAANYYGYAVVVDCAHSYIPTPDEALIEKEEWMGLREEVCA